MGCPTDITVPQWCKWLQITIMIIMIVMIICIRYNDNKNINNDNNDDNNNSIILIVIIFFFLTGVGWVFFTWIIPKALRLVIVPPNTWCVAPNLSVSSNPCVDVYQRRHTMQKKPNNFHLNGNLHTHTNLERWPLIAISKVQEFPMSIYHSDEPSQNKWAASRAPLSVYDIHKSSSLNILVPIHW